MQETGPHACIRTNAQLHTNCILFFLNPQNKAFILYQNKHCLIRSWLDNKHSRPNTVVFPLICNHFANCSKNNHPCSCFDDKGCRGHLFSFKQNYSVTGSSRCVFHLRDPHVFTDTGTSLVTVGITKLIQNVLISKQPLKSRTCAIWIWIYLLFMEKIQMSRFKLQLFRF